MDRLKSLISVIFMGMVLNISAQTPTEIILWPDGAPQNNGITASSEIENNHVKTNITEAKLYVYEAAGKPDNAIVICPGGGYAVEAIFHEGHEYASWLASNGITGIVMEYRLPNKHHDIPLADAQQAIRLVREKGYAKNVGISGFSAGGHLASTAGTHFDMGKPNGNTIEKQSCRPDFMILFYPVITMDKSFTHMGSRTNLLGDTPSDKLVNYYSNEKQITKDTPPTLLLLSDDDGAVVPKNSVSFYSALKDNNVNASMYIFPVGGHGWGMNKNFAYHDQWKSLLLKWIEQFK